MVEQMVDLRKHLNRYRLYLAVLAAFVAKKQKCLSWAELLITSVLVGKTSSVGLGVMRGLTMVLKGASLLYGVNTGMVP